MPWLPILLGAVLVGIVIALVLLATSAVENLDSVAEGEGPAGKVSRRHRPERSYRPPDRRTNP
jgi:hypothetical protein